MPPASAASNGAAQPPAGTAGTSSKADHQLLDTNEQAVSSRAAVTAPPVQHALPPLIQQLLSRTANRSPQASAVAPADSSSMHQPSSALPPRLDVASAGSAEHHDGTASSMPAPDAELPVLPMPVEAAASVPHIPEFGSIGPHLGLAFALQKSSPGLPQPQTPSKQEHISTSKPVHNVTALAQPAANGLCSQEPVEESVKPQSLPPPQAAYISPTVKSPDRAAYMPMHQPGSLQCSDQESVTASVLPTEAPSAAQQRPRSQPDSMHGQGLESAPHPAAQNGLPTGAMQTPRPSGSFRACAATCCRDCPTCWADRPLNSCLPDTHQASAESCQDEWRSLGSRPAAGRRLPGSLPGVGLPGQSVAGADLPGRPTACDKLA